MVTRPAARLLPALLLLTCLSVHAPAAEAEFNRDVRPILADACFHCHGPDKARRKGDLRLDTEDARKTIMPGKPNESELFRRVTEADPARRMPPAKSGHTLTAGQVDTLRRWIEQGGKWDQHWAFVTPRRPPTPSVRDTQWARNGIDPFILTRLEAEGLKPSPETDKVTLIRRVALDLTGLPPTPKEVDDFVADRSPDAYEKVVTRLLASPRYGEHLARSWLDAARYADTSGYQSDGERHMWRWRDWVIAAFNRNMPFDRFTVEQIAGDMLPNATLEQKIATGFNRNHRGNAEGGIIPEEYAVEYVVDRVETTATVFLGLTLGCARCHDHKYDPFAQKEFYRLFAYFNNVPEHGRAIKLGNSPPYIKAPTPEQQRQLGELDRKVKEAEDTLAKRLPEIDAAQAEWEATFKPSARLSWAPSAGLIVPGKGEGKFRDGEAAFAPGRVGKALDLDGKRHLDLGDVANFGFFDRFSVAAWVRPRGSEGGTIVSRMVDAPQADGYGVGLTDGRVRVHLTKRWLDDALRVETEAKLEPDRWYHVLVTYDGSRLAAGVRVYVNGEPQKVKVLLDELNQTFATKEPLRAGAGGGPEARFHGLIDDVRVYDDRLGPDEAVWLATAETIDEIMAVPAAKRTAAQASKLRAYYLEQHAPEALRTAERRVRELHRQREALLESVPTVMVMEESLKPRDTFVLRRGEYDKRGEKVTPGVPSVLPPLPKDAPNNRLGLARWLVDPSNPLTARVTVNRFWQNVFGAGLVRTPEDYGMQGEPPTHPELLDWLATEFVRTGWDVKAMHKLIVTSATYRQSSRVSPELLRSDPDNRLLARGPRFRLPAETVRDQALAASGLLVEKVGGPSVKPYQPAGPWKELADADYFADNGEGLYRRSLYTFWKRTVPPPNMTAFDAPARETCVVRATRTNTPLQALTLLNDVTYVEAARVLAERVMREGGTSPEERLTLAFRLATSRRPQESELRLLVAGWRRHRETYRADPRAAEKLLAVGEAKRKEKVDRAELAAYAATLGVILNLDETVTRE
jgi:hypothetical protein